MAPPERPEHEYNNRQFAIASMREIHSDKGALKHHERVPQTETIVFLDDPKVKAFYKLVPLIEI